MGEVQQITGCSSKTWNTQKNKQATTVKMDRRTGSSLLLSPDRPKKMSSVTVRRPLVESQCLQKAPINHH